jgi:hypothetical protein
MTPTTIHIPDHSIRDVINALRRAERKYGNIHIYDVTWLPYGFEVEFEGSVFAIEQQAAL